MVRRFRIQGRMGKRRLVFDVAADHPFGADVEMRSGVLLEVFGGFGKRIAYSVSVCMPPDGNFRTAVQDEPERLRCLHDGLHAAPASLDLTSVTVSPYYRYYGIVDEGTVEGAHDDASALGLRLRDAAPQTG